MRIDARLYYRIAVNDPEAQVSCMYQLQDTSLQTTVDSASYSPHTFFRYQLM